MSSLDIIAANKAQIRGAGRIVVLPEGEDDRVIRAAGELVRDALAVPVLLGDPETIAAQAKGLGVPLDGITVRTPDRDDALTAYANQTARARDRMSPRMAARLVRKPLYFAGAMVAADDAAAMVAGVTNPTRRVIEAGLMTVGLEPGISIPSSFFLMVVPSKEEGEPAVYVFADCAVNADPTADELADIAVASGHSAARLLGTQPKIALLSFSTHGSATHAHVDKVQSALERVRRAHPDILIDGELQADAAISRVVAEKKVRTPSAVAGAANVLVFPDLDAGNIAYKLVQYMAGAQAIGPFLQGFAKPLSDLSRGASVDDIVSTIAVTLALA